MTLSLVSVALLSAWASIADSPRVTTAAPGWTFTSDEAPSFSLTAPAPGLCWKLFDWQGLEIGAGRCPADGRLVFHPLPPGYYRVRFEGSAGEAPSPFSFCVMRTNPCRDPDSFYAVDSAFTEVSRRGVYDCPWYGGDSLRVTAELMGKCGITHTRERNPWPEMEPERGKYAFDAYLANARLLADNGIRALGLLQGTPKWMRRPGRSLPGDLVETYRFLKAAARTFEPYYEGWEFWNEPEWRSTSEPVWEFAAATKAAALGVRDGSETAVFLSGALTGVDYNGYARNLFASDLCKYVQAFNIHLYRPPSEFASWMKDVRTFLSDYGLPDAQIWLTESGTELESHGRVPSTRKGLMAHDGEQEMVVAEFAVKSAILQRFNGTFRNWFFLFGAYNERQGEKDWGSMRRDGSVKPVHAAFSALTGELGGADQLGRVNLGRGISAYLYARKDGRRTLVLWTESPVDTDRGSVLGKTSLGEREVAVPIADGSFELTDMMGSPRRAEGVGGHLRLKVNRYPQYLTGTIALPVEAAARPTGRRVRYRPAEDEDLSVVIRPEVDAKDFSVVGKSVAELQGERGRIRFEVWNLSDTAKCGNLSFSTGNIRDLPPEIRLPAWGMAEVSVDWAPEDGTNCIHTLDVGGVFGGKRVSRVRIPVSCPYRFLSSCTVRKLERLNRPESWRRNDSGVRWSCRYDEREEGLRFDVAWKPDSSRWFYPECELKLPEETLADARYLEFEVKTVQDKVENDFSDQNVMLVGTPPDEYLTYLAPTFAWEKRRVLLPPSARRATSVRIGANPKGTRLTFWLRNVRLLK